MAEFYYKKAEDYVPNEGHLSSANPGGKHFPHHKISSDDHSDPDGVNETPPGTSEDEKDNNDHDKEHNNNDEIAKPTIQGIKVRINLAPN